jgi:hypothetical protein
MAISPNVDFVSGAILTASQQNAFGRGIVALGTKTATDATVTTEEIQITSSSFTAIANRYYKITYTETEMTASAAGYMQMSIRKTNLAGTGLGNAYVGMFGNTTQIQSGTLTIITTLTAGAQVVVGTLTCSAGTGKASAAATQPSYIIVEDLGPA